MKCHVLVGTFAATAVLACLGGVANAFQDIYAPFGYAASNRVHGVIGTDGAGNVWIDWKKRTTGDCTSTWVGAVGSVDDTYVNLTAGNDIFEFAPPSSGIDLCGYGSLVQWNSSEADISTWADDGNDVVDSHFRQGSGASWGGANNDWIYDNVWAGGGTDTNMLISFLSYAANMGGGPDVDCLSATFYYGSSSLFSGTFDCNAGNDFYAADESGFGSYAHHPPYGSMNSCETSWSYYCTGSTLARPSN